MPMTNDQCPRYCPRVGNDRCGRHAVLGTDPVQRGSSPLYIASLYDLGLLEQSQFDKLILANVRALNDWKIHHAGMNAEAF